MGSLLIVTGPPGAGTSTVARLLAARDERSVLVEGDAFFGFLAAGAIAPWQPAADEQNVIVATAAASATGAFVRGDDETVYDGVLRPPAARALGARGAVSVSPTKPGCQHSPTWVAANEACSLVY